MSAIEGKLSLNSKPTAPASLVNKPIVQLLADIRDGRWRKQVDAIRATYTDAGGGEGGRKAIREAKRETPMICWGGTFNSRGNDKLVEHSSIICADLDDVPDLPDALKRLCSYPFVLACYLSVSGTELKVLFIVEPRPSNDREHKAAFEAVRAQLAVLGFEACNDTGTSDVSRGSTVSYDPELYLDERARWGGIR